MDKKPNLNLAYTLETPKDSEQLYRVWAKTYDSDFALANGYAYANEVARVFDEHATSSDQPILDIGAGTGLVGEALKSAGYDALDALDISPEMLDVARAKHIYRSLHCADLTKPLTLPKYAGVISAGTFTHGHLGPEVLSSVLDLGQTGALFVLGINSEHFQSKGFKAALDDMSSKITQPTLIERPIYKAHPDPNHAKDTALITVFRKT